MSKAVLVRGAFAIQCNSPAPPVWLTVTACSHACSHYHSPIGMTGTVQTSDLAKWRQDDVCCRRTIHRWKAETLTFPAMYGTTPAEQKKFIHTSVSSKRTVHVPGTVLGSEWDKKWDGKNGTETGISIGLHNRFIDGRYRAQ